MKKTNTNKGLKKLIPAAGMLMLSAAMLGTSTFAWFTMNKEVSVTGMTVHTTVESNLLISNDSLSSTSKNADSSFSTATLTQTIEKILEPVSTDDGKEFYYTVDALATGDARVDAYTLYNASSAATGDSATDYLNKFSQDYGLTKTEAAAIVAAEQGAVGYVDYVFQLKADNTATAAEVIDLTQMDLTYTAPTNGAADTNNAYRAAIFVEDITSGTATADAGSLVGIWAPTGATNFSGANAVDSTTTVTGNVTYVNAATGLASVDAGTTKYYKVVVRLWIEGEDTTCYSAKFKDLTGSWALDLKFKLQDNNTAAGVTSINMLPTRS
jgi:hypothetical protein